MLESFKLPVVLSGNGARVSVPRKFLNQNLTVLLEQSLEDVKSEVLRQLEPFLQDIEGVFLYGSHARGDASFDSDVDVLVVCEKKLKLKHNEKFEFEIREKKDLIKQIKTDFTMFEYNIIQEAKPIFNETLLQELKQLKAKPNLAKLLSYTEWRFKKTRELLDLTDKVKEKVTTDDAHIYSLILRLKILLRINCFLNKQVFYNNLLIETLKSHGFSLKQIQHFLKVHRMSRFHEEKFKTKVSDIKKLFKTVLEEHDKTNLLVVKKWLLTKKSS